MKDIYLVIDRKNNKYPMICLKMKKERYKKIFDIIEKLTEIEIDKIKEEYEKKSD